MEKQRINCILISIKVTGLLELPLYVKSSKSQTNKNDQAMKSLSVEEFNYVFRVNGEAVVRGINRYESSGAEVKMIVNLMWR